jgi:hypothetical protein
MNAPWQDTEIGSESCLGRVGRGNGCTIQLQIISPTGMRVKSHRTPEYSGGNISFSCKFSFI